jgi:hypothetical protein
LAKLVSQLADGVAVQLPIVAVVAVLPLIMKKLNKKILFVVNVVRQKKYKKPASVAYIKEYV